MWPPQPWQILVFLLVFWLPTAAAAAPSQQIGGGSPSSSLGLRDRLSGQTGLEALGVSVDLFFNHFYGVNFRADDAGGALHKGSGSLDLFLQGNAREMGLRLAGHFLLQLKSSYGRNVNPEVGALSDPFDDADFDEPIYVNAFWYQRDLWEDWLRLRLGYLNQAAILDRNQYANSEDRQFMSTFLDNNGIVPLKIGLGLTVFVHPTPWMTFMASVVDADNSVRQAGFDTAFDDLGSLMLHFEANLRQLVPLQANYRFGLFHDPRQRSFFETPSEEAGDTGFYISFDQLLYQENGSEDQGLGLFQRYGYRAPRQNQIAHFWSAGLQYQGLLPGRKQDVLGLGVYAAHSSNLFRELVEELADRETGLELYYRIPVTGFLDLTPDLQFIDNPGAVRGVKDQWIFGLRLRVTL